jgi:signal transduction histidine kinase
MKRVRLGLFVAALLAVAGIGAAALGLAARHQAPFPGFLVYRSGAVTSLWRSDWAGYRLGLRVRDQVVAIGDEPVRGGREVTRALAARAGEAEVRVRLVSPDGADKEVRLPLLRLGRWDLGYTLWLPFSIGLLYLLLGALIYLVRPSPASALASALFLLAAAFYLVMFDAHTTHRLVRVWHLYPLLGPLSVHLFALFPERRPGWARPAVLGPLYAVGLAVVAWRQVVLDDPRAADHAALASSVMLAAEFMIDLGLLGRAMLHGNTPAVRNRAKSIFVGLAATCGAAVLWQFASRIGPPAVSMSADQAMILSALFPVLIAYAILKRNLLDVDAVLRASLVYGLASALILVGYFVLVVVGGDVAARLSGRSTNITVAAVLLFAALFHPLRLRAQRLVDRLWHRDEAAEREVLDRLGALDRAGGLQALVEAGLSPLCRATQARAARLWARVEPAAGEPPHLELIGEAGEPGHAPPGAFVGIDAALTRFLGAGAPVRLGEAGPPPPGAAPLIEAAEVLVPLFSGGYLVGVVALGARRRGAWGYGLLRTLEAVAPPLALALDNALLVAEGARRERLAALGQLAAVVVHEIKNPLGIIKVAAGALKKRAPDEPARELAGCVEEEVDRMDATMRRLLELARPARTTLRPCDLTQVIRHTLDRITPDLEAACIAVKAQLQPVPVVQGDAEELRGALINLFLNARQAMPEGGTLSVRLAARPEDGRVEIEVADTGCGMDEDTRRQLFRPFFTTRHGGTGLGLALVKRVVDGHKGAIGVDSTPGQGTTFRIALPL